MNRQLRDNVWDGLNDSDRARRYYGELAGRLNQRERGATLLVTALALTALAIHALGQQQLVLWGVLLTTVASFVPVFYRVAGRVAMASYREKALGDLYAEWMVALARHGGRHPEREDSPGSVASAEQGDECDHRHGIPRTHTQEVEKSCREGKQEVLGGVCQSTHTGSRRLLHRHLGHPSPPRDLTLRPLELIAPDGRGRKARIRHRHQPTCGARFERRRRWAMPSTPGVRSVKLACAPPASRNRTLSNGRPILLRWRSWSGRGSSDGAKAGPERMGVAVALDYAALASGYCRFGSVAPYLRGPLWWFPAFRAGASGATSARKTALQRAIEDYH